MSRVAISADGSKIASGAADKLVKLWNAADGAAIASLAGHAGGIVSTAFSADNLRVVSCSSDGVRTWDVAGQAIQNFSTGDVTAKGVAVATDNKSLLSIDLNNGLNTYTTSLTRVFAGHEGAVTALTFNADGTRLIRHDR